MQDYSLYYQSIEKPFFSPPEWVFGFAWGLIYPLIAIAFVYLLFLLYKEKVKLGLVMLFITNLIANFAFTPIQLDLQSTLLATLDIYIVLATLLVFQYKIYKTSKLIFILLIPYALWGTFATVLQTTIFFMN
ncbi:TspO/MBR family protein [Patescibacteria group bacterium]